MTKALLFISSLLAFSLSAHSQRVELNKPLVLTGSSASDRQVKNLALPAQGTDAASAEAVQSGQLQFATATNTNNNLQLVLTPAPTAYAVGMVVNFKAPISLSGPVTINLNGLGTKSIKKQTATDLTANDVLAGQMVSLVYDGTHFQLLSSTGEVVGSSYGAGVSQAYAAIVPRAKYQNHLAFPVATTWTVPTGVTEIMVEVWSAGGGHGGATIGAYPNAGGGGGGAGGYGRQVFQVVAGTTYTLTIGTAGAVGRDAYYTTSPYTGNSTYNPAQAGMNGGSTTFGSLVSVTGGKGGGAATLTGTYGTVAAGGVGGAGGTSTASVNYSGGSGQTAYYAAPGDGGGGLIYTSPLQAVPAYVKDYIDYTPLGTSRGGGGGSYNSSSSENGCVVIHY